MLSRKKFCVWKLFLIEKSVKCPLDSKDMINISKFLAHKIFPSKKNLTLFNKHLYAMIIVLKCPSFRK